MVCFNSILSVGRHSLIYLILQQFEAHREIEISIFTDDVNIRGRGVGSLMTFDDEGGGGLKMVLKLMT